MAYPYYLSQYGEEMPARPMDPHKWNSSAEEQSWNLVAKRLALEDQMRPKLDGNFKGGDRRSSGDAAANKPGKGKRAEAAKKGALTKLRNLDLDLDLAADNGPKASGVSASNAVDKRFKSLPPAERLPRNETLAGYIFVCNNDTMQEDLKRQLFGLPQRYRDSVRAIQPGLPLFLYNYTTHQLHGIYEAASFGGSNIDPTAWEDKKSKGGSRFPAQVLIRVRKLCKPLEEELFRPVLHHYDGPKFRLQLCVPETLALLDLFAEKSSM